MPITIDHFAPKRSTIIPETGNTRIVTSDDGKSTKPVCSEFNPRKFCKNSGTKKRAPKSANCKAQVIRLPLAKFQSRKSRISKSGYLEESSTTIRAQRQTAPKTLNPMTLAEPQPSLAASPTP